MNSVKRGDSGNYTCVASNSARVTTHTAHLTISGNLPCSFLSQSDGFFEIAHEHNLLEVFLW
jgi:hypothetical protein